MKIKTQAYQDADDRLAMARAVLDIVGELVLHDSGRHLSNAVWAAATLIEDAQSIFECEGLR